VIPTLYSGRFQRFQRFQWLCRRFHPYNARRFQLQPYNSGQFHPYKWWAIPAIPTIPCHMMGRRFQRFRWLCRRFHLCSGSITLVYHPSDCTLGRPVAPSLGHHGLLARCAIHRPVVHIAMVRRFQRFQWLCRRFQWPCRRFHHTSPTIHLTAHSVDRLCRWSYEVRRLRRFRWLCRRFRRFQWLCRRFHPYMGGRFPWWAIPAIPAIPRPKADAAGKNIRKLGGHDDRRRGHYYK